MFAIALALYSTACGTLPSGRGWGENAFRPVARTTIAEAAKNAALDPITWVPLVGASVIGAGGWDDGISDWARRETPLFGSVDAAQEYSDIARLVLQGEAIATGLLTPSGDDAGEWVCAKGKGLLLEGVAAGATTGITWGLKETIGRERPDRSDNASMPSGHASSAFAAMALSNRNLDYLRMGRYERAGVQATNVVLASSVAWARVEGEKHFPTDILVGAALGNFTTRFLYEAFIGTRPDDKFTFYVEPSPSGGSLAFVRKF
ncbi:MAG: phosphatase PAP2 family protein [Chthoniobacterales bacterium]